MDTNIKVSIIVPSYKRGSKLVKRALQSLLSQTYTAIEIILVDDNAKFEHREYRTQLQSLINELADNRIRYIENKENLGGALSRNAGIEIANGEYITFLDDDDLYRPNKIERQLLFMVENKIDMSFTDLAIYNEQNELIDYREYKDIPSFEQTYLLHYHLTKQITGTPTFMCKRSILLKINGFDDVKMGQEYYLMMKLIQSHSQIGYLPESDVVAYRYNIEAISTGPAKISGERALYQYKKSFFSILKTSEKRYIRCRHYAVMAVAYKRNGKFLQAFGQLVVSVCCAPVVAAKEALGLFKRRRKNRGK